MAIQSDYQGRATEKEVTIIEFRALKAIRERGGTMTATDSKTNRKKDTDAGVTERGAACMCRLQRGALSERSRKLNGLGSFIMQPGHG